MSSSIGPASIAGIFLLAAGAAQSAPLQSVGPGEGDVDIVAWPGYIERGETDKTYDWVTEFEKETGCKVSVKTADTSDEMVALMNEGGFDLVTASGDASLRLVAGKRVQEINIDLIPSWGKVDERLQNAPWHTVDGKHYGVPYQWGSNVLMYNTEVLHEAAHQLERGLRGADPARRQVEQGPRPGLRRPDLHRRRRALPDAAQARARHQGPLRAQRGPVQGGARPAARSSARSSTATGTTPSSRSTTSPTRASSRSSWPFQVNLLESKKQPIASVIPEEGATGWADTTMMHADAPHPNCAYMWMEHSLVLEAAGRPRRLVRLGAGGAGGLQGQRAARPTTAARPTACRTSTRSTSGRRRSPSARRRASCVPYYRWVTDYIAVLGGR